MDILHIYICIYFYSKNQLFSHDDNYEDIEVIFGKIYISDNPSRDSSETRTVNVHRSSLGTRRRGGEVPILQADDK